MKLSLKLSFHFLIICSALVAQDTIKIQRDERYDKNCFLIICINNECFTDSIPLKLFSTSKNIELRMNKDCTINKSFDVFVSSFEIATQINEGNQRSNAQSSFFTDSQKRIIQKIKTKDIFKIKNIIVHAPDGFKKMDDLIIVIN